MEGNTLAMVPVEMGWTRCLALEAASASVSRWEEADGGTARVDVAIDKSERMVGRLNILRS
jgi:hypothetical protein